MKVVDLQEACEKLNLPKRGTKAVLQQRLLDHIANGEDDGSKNKEENEEEQDDQPEEEQEDNDVELADYDEEEVVEEDNADENVNDENEDQGNIFFHSKWYRWKFLRQ